jgi:hypothetical protein
MLRAHEELEEIMAARINTILVSVALAVLLGGVSLSVFGQQRPYRLNDQEMQQLLRRIENRTDVFRSSLNQQINQSGLDTPRGDQVDEFLRDFQAATVRLRDRFNNRQAVECDVQEVLNRASLIDRFMSRRHLGGMAERDWSDLRSDLNQLADAYNVSWSWEDRANVTPGGPAGSADRLTATYRLDVTRSDRATDAIDRATRGLAPDDQERVRNSLSRRLDSPELLAIDRRGRTITLASSNAPQVSFEADGRELVEQRSNGRTVRTTVTIRGDQLVVSSMGDRGSDYEVTFDPIDNGRALRVTRSLYSDRLTQPIRVQSIYNRTSDVARLDLYSGPRDLESMRGRPRPDFAIADGTQLTAVLNDYLTTKQARQGDRFTMTVRSPSEYNGSIIEGYVGSVDRSGRVSGRAAMSLEFEHIRLSGGNSYGFAGFIEGVRTPGGEDVRVDNEGRVRDSHSQTQSTVTHAAIGGAIGALIGAIAGGGTGAAIGAGVGVGVGAGSIFIQGRDDLDLMNGTEFTIRASAPRQAAR